MYKYNKRGVTMAIKDKIVNCIAINLAKEKYGDSNKKHEFYIEAEDLFKTLLLQVFVEKAHGDPLEYVTFLENVKEICNLDCYDIDYIESLVFN